MAITFDLMAIIGIVGGGDSNSNADTVQKSSKTAGETTQATHTWPQDIYPESGYRLPLPKRDDFDEDGKNIFDKISHPDRRRLAGMRGPSGIRLQSPKLAEKANALNKYLRYESGFSARVREVAILITAREMDSQFEWTAHEPAALKEGVPQEIIDIIKYRKSVKGAPETDAVIIQFGRQLFGQKKVSSETFAHALKIFGPKKLVELVSLMANYASTALLLCAFDMQLSRDQKPLLPD